MAITQLNNRSINRSDTASAGQKWTATSATATDFQAAGGITAASQWRLTSSFDGDAAPIASNLAANTSAGAGVIGSAMSQSSGIFTFPSTGIWQIIFTVNASESGTVAYHTGTIKTTTNNSSYATAANCDQNWDNSGTAYSVSTCTFLFDVTDTTQCKVRFDIDSSGSSTTEGTASYVATGMSFLRLGDT
jgi:hypothetical protein